MVKADKTEPSNQSASPEDGHAQVKDAQILAEEELMKSYEAIERLTARPATVPCPAPRTSASPLEPEARYEQEVYQMFACRYRHRSSNAQATLLVAEALAKAAAHARDPGPAVYIGSIIHAMKRFATGNPKSIDFLLSTFATLTRSLPDALTTEYGRGSAAGLCRLRTWLQAESNGLGGERSPEGIASLDARDRSNIKFHNSHVTASLEGILAEIEAWKAERTSCIITAAIHSRAFALGLMRTDDGRQIEDLINAGLVRKRGRWSKSDFISACILLRGCARSLLEQDGAKAEAEEKREGLKNLLQGFLQDAKTWDECFVVKAHATVCPLSDWFCIEKSRASASSV